MDGLRRCLVHTQRYQSNHIINPSKKPEIQRSFTRLRYAYATLPPWPMGEIEAIGEQHRIMQNGKADAAIIEAVSVGAPRRSRRSSLNNRLWCLKCLAKGCKSSFPENESLRFSV